MVDLPTPEPAKMPIRCPAQSGVNRSTMRTPVAQMSADTGAIHGGRRFGEGERPLVIAQGQGRAPPRRQRDLASASITRPRALRVRMQRYRLHSPDRRAEMRIKQSPRKVSPSRRPPSIRTTLTDLVASPDIAGQHHALAELEEG